MTNAINSCYILSNTYYRVDASKFPLGKSAVSFANGILAHSFQTYLIGNGLSLSKEKNRTWSALLYYSHCKRCCFLMVAFFTLCVSKGEVFLANGLESKRGTSCSSNLKQKRFR